MVTSEKHQKSLLGGIERFVGLTHPDLLPMVPKILMALYQKDLLDEEVVTQWGTHVSKKYVDKEISKKVRKASEPFLKVFHSLFLLNSIVLIIVSSGSRRLMMTTTTTSKKYLLNIYIRDESTGGKLLFWELVAAMLIVVFLDAWCFIWILFFSLLYIAWITLIHCSVMYCYCWIDFFFSSYYIPFLSFYENLLFSPIAEHEECPRIINTFFMIKTCIELKILRRDNLLLSTWINMPVKHRMHQHWWVITLSIYHGTSSFERQPISKDDNRDESSTATRRQHHTRTLGATKAQEMSNP